MLNTLDYYCTELQLHSGRLQPFYKYYTRMKVTDSVKHSILLWYRFTGSTQLGLSLACKYETRVEVTDSAKHFSLLLYRIATELR